MLDSLEYMLLTADRLSRGQYVGSPATRPVDRTDTRRSTRAADARRRRGALLR